MLETHGTMLNECTMHVTGYIQTSRGHWVYEIEISDTSGHLQQYILRKRYREFRHLYTQVSDFGTLPAFPLAGIWTYLNGSNVQLLDERCQVFDQILTRMQAIPMIRYSQAFIDFLGIQPFSKRQSGYVSLGSYGGSVSRLTDEMEKNLRKKKNPSTSCAGSSISSTSTRSSFNSNSQYTSLGEDMFTHPTDLQNSWRKNDREIRGNRSPEIQIIRTLEPPF